MNNFCRIVFFYQREKMIQKTNSFLFWLYRIPILGKKIPTTLYQAYDFKKVLHWMMLFKNLLFKVLQNGLLMFFIFLGANAFQISHLHFNLKIVHQTLFLWFVLSCLFSDSQLILGNIIEYDIVKFARTYQLSMQKTVRFLALYQDLENLLAYILPAYILGLIAQRPFKVCFFVLTFKCFFHQLAKVLNRNIYLRPFVQKYCLSFASIFSLFCLIVGVLWYLFLPYTFLFSWSILLVMALGNVVLLRILLNQQEDRRYIYALIDKKNEFFQRLAETKKSQLIHGSMMKDKLTLKDDKNFSYDHGPKMLNQLLFHRYRFLLRKMIKKRMIAFAIIFFLLSITRFFNLGIKFADEKRLISTLPLAFIGMYTLGFGKQIVEMCFVNCDKVFLYYPFYRKEKTILAGFYERLKKFLSLI